MSEEPIGTLGLPSMCIPPLLAGEELIARPEAGDSMTGDDILPGDVLLIARGREPADGASPSCTTPCPQASGAQSSSTYGAAGMSWYSSPPTPPMRRWSSSPAPTR